MNINFHLQFKSWSNYYYYKHFAVNYTYALKKETEKWK